jgi:hypothetical protein
MLLADEVASVPRSTNNTIINNLIFNTSLSAFGWTAVPNSGLKNVLIANNTIIDGSLSTGAGGNPAIVNIGSQIKNNIIWGRNSNVPSNSGITFSNNNWQVTPSTSKSSSDIIADPQIARTGTTTPGTLTPDYFKLLASSPVIGVGIALPQVTEDFFRTPRTGSKSDIGAYVFLTPGVDSIAPSTPTNLSATANSSTQVNLAWNASTDNVGVTGYKIYRNGTQIGTSTVASLIDAATTGGTTYSYTVTAFDAAGNPSALSNAATVTTPPAIVPVNISSYNTGNITANSAQINWTTNIPSIGVVSYGTGATNLSSIVNANNQLTSQSVPITGLSSGTPYYFKISAGSSSAASSFSTLAASSPVSNIAPLASITASTETTWLNQQAIKAVDGIVKSWPDNTHEWATIGEKVGAWILLKWNKTYTVNKVVLYDRPNRYDQITSATITFSNGSSVKVGELINSGDAVVINFPATVTNSINITVNTVSKSTANIGLDELNVFGF